MTSAIDIAPEHFRLLFEHAPGSFLVLLPDDGFTIVGVTRDYLHDTLTRREDIMGKPVFEAFPDNPRTPEANSTRNLRASLQRVLATKQADTMAVQRYDVPRRGGAGFELRYWSPVNTPLLSPAGEILYIIHRVENVTEYVRLAEENRAQRREQETLSARNQKMEAEIVERSRELDARNEELRQANAALARHASQAQAEARHKDEFLAMLAHELRNPLAGISNALTLLGMDGIDAGKVAQLREVCRRQLGNLTRLVDDLLDVSRISRGAVHLRREALDLRDILESAFHAVRGMLDARGIAVSTRTEAGSYAMLGDATRLEQVIGNLLANAAKFTEPGGRIDILLGMASAAGRPVAVLEIRDTGQGIPADKLSAIFDMFVQVETGIDRARGGLGIGLTLVQKLVEAHGGTVAAHSDGPGRGSIFTVRLPLEADAVPPAPRADAMLAHQRENAQRRLLLIEDNADARDTLQGLLEAAGYAVDVAATGQEGLQRLLALRPDVAIVDIGLPGLDGFEIARRARAAAAGAIRLIALSGYSGPDVEDEAVRAGFDLCLVKPVRMDDLAQALAGDRSLPGASEP